jgi:signal transduction histidine kinase
MDDPDRIETVLAQTASRLGAVGVAVYEAGRTLATNPALRLDDPNWTGVIYLVGGWAAAEAPRRSGELGGFPDTLNARDNSVLLGIIGNKTSVLIDDPADCPIIFANSAAQNTNARAAVLTNASFNVGFPSLAILYFRTAKEARHQVAPMRDAEAAASQPTPLDRADVPTDVAQVAPHELSDLRERLLRRAEQRHFEFLARFQRDYFLAMGQPTIEAQQRDFDKLVREEIDRLAEHLHCSDLRVYLLDDRVGLEPDETGAQETLAPSMPRVFRLQWASWSNAPPWPVASDDTGPIGWSLRNGKTFGVHNRRVMLRFPKAREAAYPKLGGMESYGRDGDGTRIGLLAPSPPEPSLIGFVESLIIHPIVIGGRVIGALVCNGRDHAPYVFHEWDETSLGVIAVTIGGNWLNLRQRQEALRDRDMLGRAAREINEFSRLIDGWVRVGNVEDGHIYTEALRAADRIVGGEAFSSIRLFDAERAQFSFTHLSGERWQRHGNTEEARSLIFRVEENPEQPARSAAAYVYRTRRPLLVDVARRPDHFRHSFPGQMFFGLYVPIFHGGNSDRLLGLLDIRATTDAPFPRTIGYVLGILAEMLGLAIAMMDTQRHLLAANQRLSVVDETQLPMLEDLTHQMLTPLRNALAQLGSLETLIGSNPTTDPSTMRTAAIITRGHIRRSYRVGLTGRLFRDLRVHGCVIQPRSPMPMPLIVLQDTLIKLIEDQRLVSDPTRDHRFAFNAAAVATTYRNDISGDTALFEQMISNLLDNADKYSRDATTVAIRAQRTRDGGRFILEVENLGYPIGRDELRLIRQRGQRGREAKLRVAEGQGIGLWIVDELIKSFGGILEIIPGSTRDDPHVFRLLFARKEG